MAAISSNGLGTAVLGGALLVSSFLPAGSSPIAPGTAAALGGTLLIGGLVVGQFTALKAQS